VCAVERNKATHPHTQKERGKGSTERKKKNGTKIKEREVGEKGLEVSICV